MTFLYISTIHWLFDSMWCLLMLSITSDLIEYLELEEIHKARQVHLLPKNQTMCLRCLSPNCLNSGRLNAVTTALGSMFLCSTTLLVKNLYLTSTLNLPCHSSMLFSWVLSLSSERRDQCLSVCCPHQEAVCREEVTTQTSLS